MESADIFEALNRLALKLATGAHIADLQRLSGGASQETWAFKLTAPGLNRDLILRRRPDGLGERDERTVSLETEAALIARVAARGAPVPHIAHVCRPEDELGEAYIMDRVPGETLGRRIVRDAAFDGVRPGLARRCGEVLGIIHSATLEDLPPMRTAWARDELDRYEEIYRSTGAVRPTFEFAFRKLRRTAPPPTEPVLLHGDFRSGNLMVHSGEGLKAVLDWELAHIGEAASDLGWLCVNSWRFGAYDRPVGGFGSYDDLLEGYRAAGGRPVALDEIRYWQMVGSLKWGVMCMIMYSTFASGADPSIERAMIGRRVSEAEIDLVNLMQGRS